MGTPSATHSEARYASIQDGIGSRYYPDPPENAGFDYVMEYRGGTARTILFFVKNEAVFHVYSWQT